MTPERLDEIEAELRSLTVYCPVCDGEIVAKPVHIPSTPMSPEEWDMELTGSCMDDPDDLHEQQSDFIYEQVDNQLAERSARREQIGPLVAEIRRLRETIGVIRNIADQIDLAGDPSILAITALCDINLRDEVQP